MPVPMAQHVTINYASLTTDKLHSSQTLIAASKPSLHFVAVLKNVKILSKFLGDEVDEVMVDTLSYDKRPN